MSQLPEHTHTSSNVVNLEVPCHWTVSVAGLSRGNCQKIVNIRWAGGSKCLTADKGIEKMHDKSDKRKTCIFKDGDRKPKSVDLSFFHSSQSQLQSSVIKVLTFSKPIKNPKLNGVPDFITFLIYVKDSSNDQPGGGQYPDTVVTVECVNRKFDLSNIQGDVVPGLPKKLQYFYFFEITHVEGFKQTFKQHVIPKITSAMKVKWTPPGERIVGLNASFSSLGLAKLGFTESLLDESFDTGQLFDARSLGDAGQTRGSYWSPSWDSEFKADIDGVLSITAHIDTEDKAKQLIAQLEAAFAEARKASLKKIVQIRASLRDGLNEPNDFFGYRDGISKPEIKDASYSRTQPMIFKGSSVVDMGVIVMGHDGDEDRAVRPQWARDGSFMVFRKLKMLAPEFRKFVREESAKMFPEKEGGYAQDLFGARLVGRWKSGTPLVLSPDMDDRDIAKDVDRVNDFNYDKFGDQSKCPFAVHVRKSNPRTEESRRHLFRRQSIPYGPEEDADEQESMTTSNDRGLVFVCYQSSILRGFKYVQRNWYNNPDFPADSGHDPMVGQTGRDNFSSNHFMTGVNSEDPSTRVTFSTRFVQSRGGEYFFVPSLATLEKMMRKEDE